MSSASQPATIDPRLIQDAPGLAGAWAGFRRRVSQGELGSLPVIVGLSAIWITFYLANDRFLSAVNLTNLMLQISAMGLISAGIVLILLLGETDLSAGAVSGLAASVMTILNVKQGWPAVPALLAGLATGAVIGLFQGSWVTRFKVPSFVVTLAGSLAWQGALFSVLGSTGSVNLQNPVITGLTSTFFSAPVSWLVVALLVAAYAGTTFLERRRRASVHLPLVPLRNVLMRMGIICGAVVVAVLVFTSDRGLPLACLLYTSDAADE